MKFEGKILVVGCGAVAQCTLPLLLKHIQMPPEKITILDMVDNKKRVAQILEQGVKYVVDQITPENFKQVFGKYVGSGDLVIDLAWNLGCIDLATWMRQNNVLYINTSVEVWDPYAGSQRNDPRDHTLYARQMELRTMIKEWGDNKGATAIVEHGANPGLVSHFTKRALVEIAQKIIHEKPNDPRRAQLEQALQDRQFNKLAMLTGVKVIHISERDTQITNKPKQVNEFVNTWSVEGFFEEGVAPAELGWGTHERTLPKNAFTYDSGPCNQICLRTIGIKTWVRSWVPSGEITGMVVRHGESFSISDRLTVWEDDKAIYRPTVHYAYCPCDAAINSLHELEMREYHIQEDQRIMNDEIIKGKDELGVLLMGHDFNAWWIGSLLDIEEARRLVPHQSATTVQVAISVAAAAMWAIKNPRRGFLLPDDVEYEAILDIAIPYLGPFVSQAVDWTPLKNLNTKFTHYNTIKPDEKDVWQFATFLVNREIK